MILVFQEAFSVMVLYHHLSFSKSSSFLGQFSFNFQVSALGQITDAEPGKSGPNQRCSLPSPKMGVCRLAPGIMILLEAEAGALAFITWTSCLLVVVWGALIRTKGGAGGLAVKPS